MHLFLIAVLFGRSRYASCLEYLENLKGNLLLDIHLHDHVETLYSQIRHKAIIQYTHPFISVDLHTMAGAFKTTVSGLEKELEALITDNQIQVWSQISHLVNVIWYEILIQTMQVSLMRNFLSILSSFSFLASVLLAF